MSVIPWMMAAWLGDAMFVQPLRSMLGAVGRAVRPDAPPGRPRVPPMSSGWLREHVVDEEKHTGDI